MTLEDRKRRAEFIVAFRNIFQHPSHTMALKCWRTAREGLEDEQLEALIICMDAKRRRLYRLERKPA